MSISSLLFAFENKINSLIEISNHDICKILTMNVRGTWVTQSVKHQTGDFGSGHEFMSHLLLNEGTKIIL